MEQEEGEEPGEAQAVDSGGHPGAVALAAGAVALEAGVAASVAAGEALLPGAHLGAVDLEVEGEAALAGVAVASGEAGAVHKQLLTLVLMMQMLMDLLPLLLPLTLLLVMPLPACLLLSWPKEWLLSKVLLWDGPMQWQ